MANYDEIKLLIDNNQTEQAIALLDEMIEKNAKDDQLYYLRGNAYRKHNNWKNALTNYATAMDLNPESPAARAYQASMDVLEFFNKDLLNP